MHSLVNLVSKELIDIFFEQQSKIFKCSDFWGQDFHTNLMVVISQLFSTFRGQGEILYTELRNSFFSISLKYFTNNYEEAILHTDIAKLSFNFNYNLVER